MVHSGYSFFKVANGLQMGLECDLVKMHREQRSVSIWAGARRPTPRFPRSARRSGLTTLKRCAWFPPLTEPKVPSTGGPRCWTAWLRIFRPKLDRLR